VKAAVTVFLPTKATLSRVECLHRAIRSVVSQQNVQVQLIVVANGPQCDRDLLNALARRPDLRLIYTEKGGFAAALKIGRNLVDTPFFAELDDDDELLPTALATRLHRINRDPSVDVVVTNGFLRSQGQDTLGIRDIGSCQSDPLRTLMDEMWLVPCAALFRTATVTPDFFATIPQAMEWTYLGALLALKRKILFVDVPTFIYNRDTSDSLSKSMGYLLSTPDAIQRLMQLDMPSEIRGLVRKKHVRSLHEASHREMTDGNLSEAWKWHLRTLTHLYGWRYLPYTRHLVK
jgi:glycosyltransferase involved in cell wall biosynthesis